MNEQKDELLAAFENPEMDTATEVIQPEVASTPVAPTAPVAPEVPVTPVTPQATPVTPSPAPSVTQAPITPAAPVEQAPVTPAQTPQQNVEVVSSESVIAPELQNAPEPTPIVNTEPAPVTPESTSSVNPTQTIPAAPEVAPVAPETAETQTDGMQNEMPNVSEEPSVSVKQEIKNDQTQDDPNFLKKNFRFILILCLVIGLFIIFLPKILSLVSGGTY